MGLEFGVLPLPWNGVVEAFEYVRDRLFSRGDIRQHCCCICRSRRLSDTHYYYRIFTVDYSGNYSVGVVLDQVQN